MKHWILFSAVYLLVFCFLAITFIQVDNFSKPASTAVFLTVVPTIPFILIGMYLLGRPINVSRGIQFVLFLLIHYVVTFWLLREYLTINENWEVTWVMLEANG